MARDQRIGIERRPALSALLATSSLMVNRYLSSTRDGAAEVEAFAIVPGERHRLADVERAGALLRPHRVGVGHLDVGPSPTQPNSA